MKRIFTLSSPVMVIRPSQRVYDALMGRHLLRHLVQERFRANNLYNAGLTSRTVLGRTLQLPLDAAVRMGVPVIRVRLAMTGPGLCPCCGRPDTADCMPDCELYIAFIEDERRFAKIYNRPFTMTLPSERWQIAKEEWSFNQSHRVNSLHARPSIPDLS